MSFTIITQYYNYVNGKNEKYKNKRAMYRENDF